jgi:DNA-binding NtrC family response regulator
LALHFLHEYSHKRKKPLKHFSPGVIEVLKQYPWPGNVRELENLVERLVILTEGETVGVSDLPENFHPRPLDYLPEAADFPDQGIDFSGVIQKMEQTLIAKALERADGVKSRAAELLKLKRTTLIEKMKKQRILSEPADLKRNF